MSWFPRPSSPSAAFRDLAAFMRQRSREQVIGASLALLVTTIIVVEFVIDAKIGTAPPPQIIYAELSPSKRTDAQILADHKMDMAERGGFEQEKRRQFRKLEKQLGM